MSRSPSREEFVEAAMMAIDVVSGYLEDSGIDPEYSQDALKYAEAITSITNRSRNKGHRYEEQDSADQTQRTTQSSKTEEA